MSVLHEDELPVDADLVRRLLAEQAPDLAGLPLQPLPASGSSNRLFRLGQELLVRLPRQPGGGSTIRKEARWVPYVAPHLPVPVPEVVRVGEPGMGYPEAWAVVRWTPGEVPVPPRTGPGIARDLAAFVNALRTVPVTPASAGDPELRWYRGGPIAEVLADGRESADACRELGVDLDLDGALAVLERAAAVTPDPRDRWLHGDLVAENLLVDGDRLVGVLDLGGLAVGAAEVDLAVAWELLDRGDRGVFREAVGADDDAWLVGAGWAVLFALVSVPYYGRTMPDRCAARLLAAREAVAELA